MNYRTTQCLALESLQTTVDSSDFEILEKTGGKLATDNYEFVPVLDDCRNNPIEHEFYVAGWKYWNGPHLLPEELSPGTLLEIVPEPTNIYDKFALQVYSHKGVKIGYIHYFYSKLICHVMDIVNKYYPTTRWVFYFPP